jgi:hypothetical protein
MVISWPEIRLFSVSGIRPDIQHGKSGTGIRPDIRYEKKGWISGEALLKAAINLFL